MPHQPLSNIGAISYLLLVLISAVLCCFFSASTASAQLGAPGSETFLTLNPATPQAGQAFTVRIEAYAYDLNRASITWNVNGDVREEFSGEQKISLTAPALGVSFPITARIVEQTGATHSATHVVTPSAIDLIIESDTKIPHFYRGRALPSAGSNVRLIAFPSLYTSSGTLADPRNLIYTWIIDKKVAKSGRNASTLAIPYPRSGSFLIELTAETSDGTSRHTISRNIRAAEPANIFYEDSPLYGLSHNAIPSDFTLLNEEISVRAEPYYVSNDIFTNAQYAWKLNNQPIENQSADPQNLTLRKTGSTGSTRIEFSIRNLNALIQAASGAFTIYFE